MDLALGDDGEVWLADDVARKTAHPRQFRCLVCRIEVFPTSLAPNAKKAPYFRAERGSRHGCSGEQVVAKALRLEIARHHGQPRSWTSRITFTAQHGREQSARTLADRVARRPTYPDRSELHDRLRHNIWAAARLHYEGGGSGFPLVVEGIDGGSYDDVFKPLDCLPLPSVGVMPRSIWFCEMRYKGGIRKDGSDLVVPLYTPTARVGDLTVRWGRWSRSLTEVFRDLFEESASLAEQRFGFSDMMPTVYFIPRVGQTTDLVVDDYRKLCVIS